MCLTDDKEISLDFFGQNKAVFKSIPIFNEEVLQRVTEIGQLESIESKDYLPIPFIVEAYVKSNFFVFQLVDDSMHPAFSKNDIVIFNPNLKARHHDNVLIKIIETNEVVFRRIHLDQSSIEQCKITLIPINDAWVPITTNNLSKLLVLGVASSNRRIFF